MTKSSYAFYREKIDKLTKENEKLKLLIAKLRSKLKDEMQLNDVLIEKISKLEEGRGKSE